MPSKINQDKLEVIEEELTKAKALFLADYSGLNVKAQQELRDGVKQAGGKLKVTKNTLLKIALKNKGIDVDKIAKELEGQNITLYTFADPTAPLKVIVDFAEKNEKPKIKAGILGNIILSMDKITQLASLPPKDQLIVQLINQIQAPLTNLTRVIQGPIQALLYTLSGIKETKDTKTNYQDIQ